MRKIILLPLLLSLFYSSCDTPNSVKDPNESHFIKFYGGDGDQTGVDFVVLPDGSFVLFGTTRPSGTDMTSQWYLVKADSKGNLLWTKTFGGPNDDEARDIELTNDNRLVLVGNTYITGTNRDIKIMTVSLDGVKLDSAVVPILTTGGIDAGGDEDAASVTQTSDGFIVAGSTTSKKVPTNTSDVGPRDGIGVRFNNDLTNYVLNGWATRQASGTTGDDVSRKIYPLSDGTFLAFGYANIPAPGQTIINYNFWYYLLGTSGTESNSIYFGDQTEDERLCSVIAIPPESGGGYFLTGLTSNSSGTTDLKISKFRNVVSFSNGDELFRASLQIRLGGTLPETAAGFATKNYTYYTMSNENGTDNNQNWILTKGSIVDGIKIWSLPIVFGGEGLDTSGSVQELDDGSVVLIGTMRTGKPDVGEFKMTLIKVNNDGKLMD